jgi:hypothetical protein
MPKQQNQVTSPHMTGHVTVAGVCTQTPALRTLRLLPMLVATEGPGSE